MLAPTKANQQQWIHEHLNGGTCPLTEELYETLGFGKDENVACYEALEWLAESDVKTLAEAWDVLPKASWLLWALAHMAPTAADVRKAQKLVDQLESSRAFQFAFVDDAASPREALLTLAWSFSWREWRARPPERTKALVAVRELWSNPWREAVAQEVTADAVP